MRTPKSLVKYRQGFTLLEILMSLTILTVTIATAYGLLTAGIKLHRRSDHKLNFDRQTRFLATALRDDVTNLANTPINFLLSDSMLVLVRDISNLEPSISSFHRVDFVVYRQHHLPNGDNYMSRNSRVLNIEKRRADGFAALWDSVVSQLGPFSTTQSNHQNSNSLFFDKLGNIGWELIPSTNDPIGLIPKQFLECNIHSPESAKFRLSLPVFAINQMTHHSAIDKNGDKLP